MPLPYQPLEQTGGESFVSCPFNEQHKMTESSLQLHIVRCMVNYPDYVSCPYNALHFFRTTEILEKHISSCPCKPNIIDLIGDESYYKELVHNADLNNVRYWNKELENWDN